MSAPIRWAAMPQRPVGPGIAAAIRSGASLSAALYRLEPGAHVPAHQHPNEEFGQVLAGRLRLRVDAQTTVLTAGEGFLIPADTPHEADAGDDGCTLLECYAPPRDPFAAPKAGDGDDGTTAAGGA